MIQTIFNLLREIHDADKPVDFRLITAFAKVARESHSQDLRAVGTYFLRYDFMLQDYDLFSKPTLAKLFKTFYTGSVIAANAAVLTVCSACILCMIISEKYATYRAQHGDNKIRYLDIMNKLVHLSGTDIRYATGFPENPGYTRIRQYSQSAKSLASWLYGKNIPTTVKVIDGFFVFAMKFDGIELTAMSLSHMD